MILREINLQHWTFVNNIGDLYLFGRFSTRCMEVQDASLWSRKSSAKLRHLVVSCVQPLKRQNQRTFTVVATVLTSFSEPSFNAPRVGLKETDVPLFVLHSVNQTRKLNAENLAMFLSSKPCKLSSTVG